MPHALLSVRRRVPIAQGDAYLAGWVRLRDAAIAAGAHAWRFRAPHQPELHLEFIEWSAGEPLLQPAVSDALALLRQDFPGLEESWEEAL